MARQKKRSDGRYESKIYIGDGKYKCFYAATQKELEAKVREYKIKIGKGIDVSTESDTFEDWANRWLSRKEKTISNGRYNSYSYRIKGMSEISKMPISKIKVSDLQEIIDSKAYSDKPASYKTLKEYKSVMHQIFEYAIVNRVIDFDPSMGLTLPRTEDDVEERRALTAEEQSWINAPTEHRGHLAAMIMMYSGLRRGELLALTWNDININAKTITVNKSVQMVDHVPKLKNSTKTKAGMRVVSIPTVLADYLKEERSKATTLLVIPNTKGSLMSDYSWKKLWNSYMKELNFKFGNFDDILVSDQSGNVKKFKKPNSIKAPVKIPMVIPNITAHYLRHTYITMLYMAGVDVLTASRQAGHSDVKTTMDIYTHLDETYTTKEMNKLDDYIQSKKAT